MTPRSRRLLTICVALAATLGFVGVSAALEGEDPTLGDPEVTCPDPSDGATDDRTTDGTDDADDAGVTDESTDDEAAVDESTDEAAVTDEGTDAADAVEPCEEPVTDTDGTTDEGATDDGDATDDLTDDGGTADDSEAPADDSLANHGAAVSQAAHECPPGPEHGPCVRKVARSDAGKRPKDEAPVDESSVDDPDATDDDAEASAGHAHGAGKEKPKG